MMSEEQRLDLQAALHNYVSVVLGLEPGNPGALREQVVALVSSWLEPLRPRDPRVELPRDGQQINYVRLGERHLMLFRYQSEEIDGNYLRTRVRLWWPAPKLESSE